MQNPNDVTVYSPTGEPFEVSRANGRDLTMHSGWSYERLIVAATPAPAPSPVAPVTKTETPAPAAPVTPPAPAAEVETPVETIETPAEDAAADEAPKARLTPEDFADLETKHDVFAYIEATFPGNKIDGRANRDKLIAFAIDLAKAA